MRDVLLVVDLMTFEHEDGAALLDSFRRRRDGIAGTLDLARRKEIPVVYANDNVGIWDGDAPGLVQRALEGKGREVLGPLAPRPGDRFVVKPRYSAFDHTPVELILRALQTERILLAGAATEGCVVQTAIDGRELEFKVSVITDACATNDERLEAISLEYLEQIVSARLTRSSDLD